MKGARGIATWIARGVIGLLVASGGCSAPPADTRAPVTPAATNRPDPEPAPRTPGRPQVAAPVGPGVDLRRDERRGGHTIARHVGRTDAQLKARLQRESIAAASTYADLESAERIVSLALADNARRLQRWVDQRAPKANLAIHYRARDALPTGRLLARGASTSRAVDGAVVVLRWSRDGWYVLTTYPEEPR